MADIISEKKFLESLELKKERYNKQKGKIVFWKGVISRNVNRIITADDNQMLLDNKYILEFKLPLEYKDIWEKALKVLDNNDMITYKLSKDYPGITFKWLDVIITKSSLDSKMYGSTIIDLTKEYPSTEVY